ncbi:MAG TPA: hypothetical protein O0W90_02550 [Methanocorpusculum sp.]|nr:hypothetical protein [Methanocorpusculum sp.]
MIERNEYANEIDNFYRKSFILENPSEMDPVLYFYLIDAAAHMDYTISALAYGQDSVKCTMTAEYLRRRVDEAKTKDKSLFPEFMVWLRDKYIEDFEETPMLWQFVYDPDETARYAGFRFVLDINSKTPLPPKFFKDMADDLFSQNVMRSLYPEGRIGRRFAEFKAGYEAKK